jgi:endonuclease III
MPGIAWIEEQLRTAHGALRPRPFSTPLEWVLWESVAHLVDDTHRAAAYAALTDRVGLSAEKIAATDDSTLLEVARLGGEQPEQRVANLRKIAELVKKRHAGDLDGVLRMPTQKAVAELARFPGIGRPGAERILLFCGRLPVLAPDSNGVRVLVRLGLAHEGRNYDATYRAVRSAVATATDANCHQLARLQMLLRKHGREVCRRAEPSCGACPLAERCAWFKAQAGKTPVDPADPASDS